ncbi:marR family protein [bacterium BMS3Bbin11]|nr:marR family protein [bacterium BMS3Abin11]GBE45311.1 marR family protein [bacterium BMS3Bbin11]GMT39500.1 MAG: hypothetical protein IEMM0001_0235 [bacterium]HDH08788.1 MarR family transcriptional regulator [Gammaproteobacteria bacterium]HDH17071.1 MarR family transcriptional regulator [Gammaproteobacteria bacterium]
MKKIVVGIMPEEKIRARMLAIARGEYTPGRGEPKVWFTSMKSLSEVLSDKNRELLHIMAESRPDSLQELAEKTHRQPSNLSRTLKTLERYGFVELKKKERKIVPIARAIEFTIHAA